MKVLFALAIALTALSGAAQASTPVAPAKPKTIRQGLGEQCSVVTTVERVEVEGGGCGEDPIYADEVRTSFSVGVFRDKRYTVEATVLDANDVETRVPLSDSRFEGAEGLLFIDAYESETITINNAYQPSPGQYELRVRVYNANTGAEVCIARQPVTVN